MPTYTYVSIDKVSPASGTTFGGTAVTITGFGFSLATGVTFDGVAATQIVYVSNTTITCVTPLHASGAVTVAVLGVGTLAAGYTYVVPVSRLPPYPYQSPITQSGASPDGLVSAAWANWWNVVKTRIEGLPGSVAAESVIGVFTASQIPQLPSSRLTMNAPRLLGRTTAGSGNSEEIRVAAGLTLAGGILSLTGLPGGYAIGDLLYADSARSLARLADVAAGSYLRSGGVATAPLWSTLTLPNAANSGDIFKASGANAMAAVAPGALTKTDDTNVTLTLGGAASTALVNAASITVGWTGTLAVARGGIGVGTLASNAVLYGNGTSAVQALAVNATATNKFLRQVSSGAPSWQQPAVADLSDGTNVALLNTANAFTANQTISVASSATTALAVRFNASNPLIGFGIANSNGFGYLGYNTISQLASDTPNYDITGTAAQLRMDGGQFLFNSAPGGTAGSAITFTTLMQINAAGGATISAANAATTALAVRYNAANILAGLTIANANGFVYLGSNTRSQVSSDGPVYDLAGAASQFRVDSGAFQWNNAAAGSAGAAITWTSLMALSSAGLLTIKGNSATYGLEGDGTNGLGIAATNASGVLRFYVRGTTKTQEFNQGATFTGAMGAAANSLELLTMANGTGSKTGGVLFVGNNSSGGGAPGLLVVNAKNTTAFAMWPDTNGIWQSSNATLTGVPEEDGTPLADTGGTVLGSVGINTGAALVFDGATKNNNVSPGTGNILRVTNSGVVTGTCLLTGITGGVNGRVLWVMNTVTTQSIQFNGEDAGSTAANRIAVTLLLPIGCSRALIYDGTSSRWRPF